MADTAETVANRRDGLIFLELPSVLGPVRDDEPEDLAGRDGRPELRVKGLVVPSRLEKSRRRPDGFRR
jgi:hypothetical protein